MISRTESLPACVRRFAGTFAFAIFFCTLVSSCDPAGWSYPTGYDSFTAPLDYDISGADLFFEAAAVSMESRKTDKPANIAEIRRLTALVMTDHPDTQAVVFPELCTSWLMDPDNQAAYYRSVAETIPGATTEAVALIAAEYDVAVVFGMAEVDAGYYYSTLVMIEPDGSRTVYRKRGLNEGDIANGCTRGAGPVTAVLDGVTVGFLICSDYQDAEVIRDLSTGGAEVIFASLATATVLNPQIDFLARSISRWVVYSNIGGANAGLTLPGCVFVADPTGTVHAPSEGPGSYSWMRIGVYR